MCERSGIVGDQRGVGGFGIGVLCGPRAIQRV